MNARSTFYLVLTIGVTSTGGTCPPGAYSCTPIGQFQFRNNLMGSGRPVDCMVVDTTHFPHAVVSLLFSSLFWLCRNFCDCCLTSWTRTVTHTVPLLNRSSGDATVCDSLTCLVFDVYNGTLLNENPRSINQRQVVYFPDSRTSTLYNINRGRHQTVQHCR